MKMKAMTVYSECDSEVAQSSTNDQPVDLRVGSVLQRTNCKGSQDKNILASLLTRSCTNSYTHSKTEGNAIHQMENAHSQKVSEYYETSQAHYSKISISERLKVKKVFLPSHKSWSRSPDLNPQPNVPTTVNIPKDSPKNIPKHIELESNPQLDREFVPNYRKFYSRYSNQSSSADYSRFSNSSSSTNPLSRYSNQSSTETVAQEADPSYTIIKERLSSSTIVPPSSTGHLYRLLQRDRPPIKRSADISPDRKDKTLRCLLSTTVEPDRPFYLEKPCDYNSMKNRHKLKLCGVNKHEFYPACHDTFPGSSPYVYCPQPVRALPVLKSILVPPAPILPPSGPPSSGSPGSESTSSGSTDSGVFSDNVLEDRRRVARVLSGRHVKSGTGASLTTLRLLRQMIIQRKHRTDRKV